MTDDPPTTKIIHGDSARLVHKIKGPINCVITDPPYGVNFISFRAETQVGKSFVKEVANDEDLNKAIALFHEVVRPLVDRMADDADLYVFTRWDIVDAWMDAVRTLHPDIKYKMLLVWQKSMPGMGDIDGNWGCGHELILYCKKGRRDVNYRRNGVISIPQVHIKELIHPTEKPVGLMKLFIEMSTDPGDLVVDPFSGSGATVVAAQQCGRRALGIEKDGDHVRNSRARLSQGSLFA